jgi:hypothetical protein
MDSGGLAPDKRQIIPELTCTSSENTETFWEPESQDVSANRGVQNLLAEGLFVKIESHWELCNSAGTGKMLTGDNRSFETPRESTASETRVAIEEQAHAHPAGHNS